MKIPLATWAEQHKSKALTKMGGAPTVTKLPIWFAFRQEALHPGVIATFDTPES